MKKSIQVIFLVIVGFAWACGGSTSSNKEGDAGQSSSAAANPTYDPKRGAGKFTKVEVAATLDQGKADSGQKVYELKCASCHKLTAEKLVGPGWSGVTGRHAAEWIMNFATNPDEMLQKDTTVQKMLEICLVRMPNQGLTDAEARNVYEFMRKNDGVK